MCGFICNMSQMGVGICKFDNKNYIYDRNFLSLEFVQLERKLKYVEF